MKKLLASPLVAAILGGGVTAGVLLGAGVVDSGKTTTVVQQTPITDLSRPAADLDGGRPMTARDIYKRDAPGVVFIRAQTVPASASPFDVFGVPDATESTGSGFVLDDDGNILTNAHVVDNATSVRVTFSDKKTRDAKIVGKDTSTDLALLRVEPKDIDLRPLELGDSSTVQVGDPTIAIGNPFGFDRTLTTGVVSALQRQIIAPDGYRIENVIQTDAAINPGNSGGPLIDAAGRVIGINSQIATGSAAKGSVGIGFAVPINTAKDVVEALKTDGRVERPWLGLEYVAIDQTLEPLNLEAKTGLLVQQVVTGGPADRAGLRGGTSVIQIDGADIFLGGDVVTSIDGKPVKSSDDVRKILESHKPGDEISLAFTRGKDTQSVTVTLGNRPAGRPSG